MIEIDSANAINQSTPMEDLSTQEVANGLPDFLPSAHGAINNLSEPFLKNSLLEPSVQVESIAFQLDDVIFDNIQ